MAKSPNDMANVQIKTEKLTPLEEYFRSWSNLMLFGSNHRPHLGDEVQMVWLLV